MLCTLHLAKTTMAQRLSKNVPGKRRGREGEEGGREGEEGGRKGRRREEEKREKRWALTYV